VSLPVFVSPLKRGSLFSSAKARALFLFALVVFFFLLLGSKGWLFSFLSPRQMMQATQHPFVFLLFFSDRYLL